MTDFKPLPQPCQDVLFFNASAPATDLFDTAELRMNAVLSLLHLVEFSDSQDLTRHQAARLAAAVGILLADARVLYEAAHLRLLRPSLDLDAGSSAENA
ncbi:hypothetical protein [Pseudomonas sp. Q1-7]|uniref:hypothetical protein n=1 Tax=Pseudomonas sp. Q1-7 TaxID=3020843 RepID=UPI002301A587|nr:hypothetical protein [Pseudomonas sp. Q1-7]